MPKICSVFCLIHIKKRSLLTLVSFDLLLLVVVVAVAVVDATVVVLVVVATAVVLRPSSFTKQFSGSH